MPQIKTNTNVCLFGAGGHGRVVASQMAACGYELLVFADGSKFGEQVDGKFSVLYKDLSDIPQYPLLVTVGNNGVRKSIQQQWQKRGNEAFTFSFDESYFSLATIGAGSMILRMATVNSGARIGEGVIINSGAIVEHDTQVGDFSHISPGAVLLGGSKIGCLCHIGANATVLPKISICGNVIIGAGATVTRNINQPGTYVGTPAKLMR